MAAHPNTRPPGGFVCLTCGDRFTVRRALEDHWAQYNHAPASVRRYALARARQSVTGEEPDLRTAPTNFNPEVR